MLQRVKGTQDFLDLTIYNFLITAAKKHLAMYSFTEIMTPILEPVELFKRSLGLTTDVVSKEMYTVTTSGHHEETICLRPEATASIMRAFYENNIEVRPWKVFSCGPMFRHERPQKGRYRQFNQISIEVLGAPSILHDAWLLTMLDRFFHEVLLLDSYALLINFLGCGQDRAHFQQVLHTFLEMGNDKLCSTCLERKEKNILRVFDCKNQACQELYNRAPKTTDHLCDICSFEWNTFKTLLEQLSVSYSHQPRLVRGLDYYTKTVFEFVSDDLGAQNSFCGGGRYDGLAQTLGEPVPLPAVGAAIGIERLLLMLEKNQHTLKLPQQPAIYAILPYSSEQQQLALFIADTLQANNLCVELFLDEDSLKSMMRKANKMGAVASIIIGPEEQAAGTVTVKNMITGAENKIAQTQLVTFLKQ